MPLVHALSVLHDGYTATLAGDFVCAARRLDEAVELLGSLGKTMWPPLAQRYRAVLALLGGAIDEAEAFLRTSLSDGRDDAPQQELPYWIEDLAAVASAKGEGRRAAILWSATDRLFETRGLAVREENRQVRDRFRVEPNQEGSSAEAWEQGRSFTLDEAIDYSLTVEASAAVPVD